MKTRPFRRATAEMLSVSAWAIVMAALAALCVFPPWTWFGVGHPMIAVRNDPDVWANVANTGWAVLLLLVVIWAGRVALYWNEEDAKAESLPEEQPR